MSGISSHSGRVGNVMPAIQSKVQVDVSQVNSWRATLLSDFRLTAITILAGYRQDRTLIPVSMQLIGKMYENLH